VIEKKRLYFCIIHQNKLREKEKPAKGLCLSVCWS